jgi:hypothetical protein
MSDTFWTAIIGGIAGLITGTVASLIAPWVQWIIRKREKRFETRAKRVNQWRSLIKSFAKRNAESNDEDYIHAESFLRQSSFYASLRQHIQDEDELFGMLDEDLVKELTRIVNKKAAEWEIE